MYVIRSTPALTAAASREKIIGCIMMPAGGSAVDVGGAEAVSVGEGGALDRPDDEGVAGAVVVPSSAVSSARKQREINRRKIPAGRAAPSAACKMHAGLLGGRPTARWQAQPSSRSSGSQRADAMGQALTRKMLEA